MLRRHAHLAGAPVPWLSAPLKSRIADRLPQFQLAASALRPFATVVRESGSDNANGPPSSRRCVPAAAEYKQIPSQRHHWSRAPRRNHVRPYPRTKVAATNPDSTTAARFLDVAALRVLQTRLHSMPQHQDCRLAAAGVRGPLPEKERSQRMLFRKSVFVSLHQARRRNRSGDKRHPHRLKLLRRQAPSSPTRPKNCAGHRRRLQIQ